MLLPELWVPIAPLFELSAYRAPLLEVITGALESLKPLLAALKVLELPSIAIQL